MVHVKSRRDTVQVQVDPKSLFQSTNKPFEPQMPTSPATHVTYRSDEETTEEKKIDDGVPLLSSNNITSSSRTVLRRRSNPLGSFLRKRKEKPSREEFQQDRYFASKEPVQFTSAKSNTPEVTDSSTHERPRRFSLGSLGKRVNGKRTERRNSVKKETNDATIKQIEVEDEDENQSPEQDPIIQIFESRNTQRVRFALEGADDASNLDKADKESEGEAFLPTDDGKAAGANIKQFMSRALFGASKSSKNLDEEMQAEVASLGGSLVWESSAQMPTGPEVVHTNKGQQIGRNSSELLLSFSEDPKIRLKVEKLLDKARKSENLHFRYEYAVKCYLKVLAVLKQANYPEDHPTVVKTIDMLNNAHHVLSSYNNSANIVKMGIKYEDSGELVRALKMYTIAYRIRRDNLSRNHPSLVVLLNMLGSIQIKRGELEEAMQIYQLALSDSPSLVSADANGDTSKPPSNLLAKSVTYREMGVIYERWGQMNEALKIYHKSLDSVIEWKEAIRKVSESVGETSPRGIDKLQYSMSDLKLTKAISNRSGSVEEGEMEITIDGGMEQPAFGINASDINAYESFFPVELEAEADLEETRENSGQTTRKRTKQDVHADMDLALTLHQIAQLHRSQGEFHKSLDAYIVSLRGMKHALGKHHPNVAAVLGNIGNLQKEMGDMDAAYTTYQEVLGIESYRLGLSHPDVAITLHNIATIDAARGNYEHSLQLYRKVIGLEKKLFGDEHISVAIANACMGDVYERVGKYSKAMSSYEEAVRIKSLCLGRHSVDVARLLHKLGKLAFLSQDCHMAESYFARALLLYRLNKIEDEHPWMLDVNRDAADIDAALAMGDGRQFEC